MTTGEQELIALIEDLIRRTENNAIPWVQSSSTTFAWYKNEDGSDFVTSIQRSGVVNPYFKASALGVGGGPSYLFQVSKKLGPGKSSTIVSLNSQEKPALTHALERLYDLIESSIDLRAASYLKKLLK
jgi:hypothetical protein